MLSQLIARTLPLLPRSLVAWVAGRYVAGEDLQAVDRVLDQLTGEGAIATVALLGEEVKKEEAARQAVDEYLDLLARLRARKLDVTLSVKLTLLGLRIGEGLCRAHLETVASAAAAAGSVLQIDMEDHTTTDATLRLYRRAQERFGNLGVAVQAYLRRTLDDIESLPRDGANVRLCKGIYTEPAEVAWQGYETIRRNFLEALEKLFARGAYVGIATHDEYLLCAAQGMIQRLGIPPERYEYQMLLGVLPSQRRLLVEAGQKVRVYVPYGRQWHPYSLRRLRENPRLITYVLGAMTGRG